jgi:hypothetical protein
VPRRSLHITIGIETDSDGHTWGAWLADAARAVATQVPMMEEDDALRRALPLQLFRPEWAVREAIGAPGHKEEALGLLKRMLRKLADDVDEMAPYWVDQLAAGLEAKRAHLASKKQQLRKFRKLFPAQRDKGDL